MSEQRTATSTDFWKKCSSCKGPIHFKQTYWVCSVSSCTRARTGLVFCKVSCWDAHGAIHRNAGAIENKAPSLQEWTQQQEQEQNPTKEPRPTAPLSLEELSQETLVVVSKVKDYIRKKSGMNTSDSVMQVLSGKVRHLADQAIAQANGSHRKTVLDRDF